MGTGRSRRPRVSAPPLRAPGTMVPRGAVTARGERGPFKSGAAMICLVLGLFAGLFHNALGGVHERTFVAIKPDGVQRRLVGEIIRRFERKGLQLVGMKLLQASEELLKEHYSALRDRPFYSRLVKYMSSGPIVAMVSAGQGAGTECQVCGCWHSGSKVIMFCGDSQKLHSFVKVVKPVCLLHHWTHVEITLLKRHAGNFRSLFIPLSNPYAYSFTIGSYIFIFTNFT
uniref:nucleoside-diphosphate kinase n=1 Tax=Geospiza parvula TaxID=87175 RepID=A0A8C3MRM3_GEOPR